MTSIEVKKGIFGCFVVGAVASSGEAVFSRQPEFPAYSHLLGLSVSAATLGFIFGRYGELDGGRDSYDSTISQFGAGFLISFFAMMAFFVGSLPGVILMGIFR